MNYLILSVIYNIAEIDNNDNGWWRLFDDDYNDDDNDDAFCDNDVETAYTLHICSIMQPDSSSLNLPVCLIL